MPQHWPFASDDGKLRPMQLAGAWNRTRVANRPTRSVNSFSDICGSYCNAGLQHKPIVSGNVKRRSMQLAGASHRSAIPLADLKRRSIVLWTRQESNIFWNLFIFSLCFSSSISYSVTSNIRMSYCTLVTQVSDIFGSRTVKVQINNFGIRYTRVAFRIFLAYRKYFSVFSS